MTSLGSERMTTILRFAPISEGKTWRPRSATSDLGSRVAPQVASRRPRTSYAAGVKSSYAGERKKSPSPRQAAKKRSHRLPESSHREFNSDLHITPGTFDRHINQDRNLHGSRQGNTRCAAEFRRNSLWISEIGQKGPSAGGPGVLPKQAGILDHAKNCQLRKFTRQLHTDIPSISILPLRLHGTWSAKKLRGLTRSPQAWLDFQVDRSARD